MLESLLKWHANYHDFGKMDVVRLLSGSKGRYEGFMEFFIGIKLGILMPPFLRRGLNAEERWFGRPWHAGLMGFWELQRSNGIFIARSDSYIP